VVAESPVEFDELFRKFRYHPRFFPELWDIRNEMPDEWGARYGVVRQPIGEH
jgi:hypothetical protein